MPTDTSDGEEGFYDLWQICDSSSRVHESILTIVGEMRLDAVPDGQDPSMTTGVDLVIVRPQKLAIQLLTQSLPTLANRADPGVYSDPERLLVLSATNDYEMLGDLENSGTPSGPSLYSLR
jgi:hypothetical protein